MAGMVTVLTLWRDWFPSNPWLLFPSIFSLALSPPSAPSRTPTLVPPAKFLGFRPSPSSAKLWMRLFPLHARVCDMPLFSWHVAPVVPVFKTTKQACKWPLYQAQKLFLCQVLRVVSVKLFKSSLSSSSSRLCQTLQAQNLSLPQSKVPSYILSSTGPRHQGTP
jgi:hypothetical protein